MPGFLEEVTVRSVRGWAADDAGRPIDVIASVNGEELGRFRAVSFRPDLARMARQDLGFEIHLDRRLEPGDIVAITNADGHHLRGSPYRVAQLRASRGDKARWSICRNMKILEIGPSYSPLAPRSGGWRSLSLDHATEEQLREKYRDLPGAEQINPVDFVWREGPIDSAIPADQHGTFDAIIASHVIEHFPDPLAFFLSAAVLLKEAGLISLVIPDKRFMFDFFRPLSQTSDYLYAHYMHRTRHSKKTAFDNNAAYVREGGAITWSARVVSNFGFIGVDTLRDAQAAFDGLVEDETGEYVDFHGTVYTPSSFELIMLELGQLGHLPFVIEHRFPTSGCEFFVTCRKGEPKKLGPDALARERLRLMKAIVRELAEQARYLHDEECLIA